MNLVYVNWMNFYFVKLSNERQIRLFYFFQLNARKWNEKLLLICINLLCFLLIPFEIFFILHLKWIWLIAMSAKRRIDEDSLALFDTFSEIDDLQVWTLVSIGQFNDADVHSEILKRDIEESKSISRSSFLCSKSAIRSWLKIIRKLWSTIRSSLG